MENDSVSAGMDENELQGTALNFDVHTEGDVQVPHENLPSFRRYYAFVVKKVG